MFHSRGGRFHDNQRFCTHVSCTYRTLSRYVKFVDWDRKMSCACTWGPAGLRKASELSPVKLVLCLEHFQRYPNEYLGTAAVKHRSSTHSDHCSSPSSSARCSAALVSIVAGSWLSQLQGDQSDLEGRVFNTRAHMG